MNTRKEAGVLLVVHGAYGLGLLEAAEVLVGPLDLAVVEVRHGEEPGELRRRILAAAAAQERGGGLLLLTDLCGSTPANICLTLLTGEGAGECGRTGEAAAGAEIVTGVNLAMLLKLSTCARSGSPLELARELRQTSQRSIRLGSELVRKGEPGGD